MQSLAGRPCQTHSPSAGSFRHAQVARPLVHSWRSAVSVQAVPGMMGEWELKVRPYTLREGDTLASIAKKRGVTIEQILHINAEMTPSSAKVGQTILLPANKLSARDREILDGIGPSYRVYPVRSGETIEDILSKRNITMAEAEALNPGVNLKKLQDQQLIKLPSNKYTKREREMLIGSGILPNEFFAAAKNPFVVGVGALLMVCGFVLAWQRFYNEDADSDDEGETGTKLVVKKAA